MTKAKSKVDYSEALVQSVDACSRIKMNSSEVTRERLEKCYDKLVEKHSEILPLIEPLRVMSLNLHLEKMDQIKRMSLRWLSSLLTSQNYPSANSSQGIEDAALLVESMIEEFQTQRSMLLKLEAEIRGAIGKKNRLKKAAKICGSLQLERNADALCSEIKDCEKKISQILKKIHCTYHIMQLLKHLSENS